MVKLDRLVGASDKPQATRIQKNCGVSMTSAALGMPQQVAVVDRAQAEELEQIVARRVDRVVQLAALLATRAAVSSSMRPAS